MLDSFERNQIWNLAGLTKYNDEGEVDEYKEILVINESAQQYGTNYNVTFSLDARLDTMRTILSSLHILTGKFSK